MKFIERLKKYQKLYRSLAIDNTCNYRKNNTIEFKSALIEVPTWHKHESSGRLHGNSDK